MYDSGSGRKSANNGGMEAKDTTLVGDVPVGSSSPLVRRGSGDGVRVPCLPPRTYITSA